MIDAKTYENFLNDAGTYIKERALQAKAERDKAESGSEEYESGRVMAFGEVIAILQQTLEAFCIPTEAMKLHDVDSDRDLV